VGRVGLYRVNRVDTLTISKKTQRYLKGLSRDEDKILDIIEFLMPRKYTKYAWMGTHDLESGKTLVVERELNMIHIYEIKATRSTFKGEYAYDKWMDLFVDNVKKKHMKFILREYTPALFRSASEKYLEKLKTRKVTDRLKREIGDYLYSAYFYSGLFLINWHGLFYDELIDYIQLLETDEHDETLLGLRNKSDLQVMTLTDIIIAYLTNAIEIEGEGYVHHIRNAMMIKKGLYTTVPFDIVPELQVDRSDQKTNIIPYTIYILDR